MSKVNAQLHEVFQALSDPTRVRMVSLMLRAQSEVCLCDLRESLGEPEYKLSKHIKVLKQSGLITSMRDGKWIYHSLVNDSEHFTAILRAIELFPRSSQDSKDLARYKKLDVPREKGRCRQEKKKSGSDFAQMSAP